MDKLTEKIAAMIYLEANPEERERRGWDGAGEYSRQTCLWSAELAIEICIEAGWQFVPPALPVPETGGPTKDWPVFDVPTVGPTLHGMSVEAERRLCQEIASEVNDGRLNNEHVSVNQVRHILRAWGSAGGEAPSEECNWSEDDDGNYESACGNMWTFIDDGPVENRMKFCPYCGKPVKAKALRGPTREAGE